MHDGIAALHALRDRARVRDVADRVVDLAEPKRSERRSDALRFPYEQANVVAAPDQLGDGMGADEAGSTGDEDTDGRFLRG